MQYSIFLCLFKGFWNGTIDAPAPYLQATQVASRQKEHFEEISIEEFKIEPLELESVEQQDKSNVKSIKTKSSDDFVVPKTIKDETNKHPKSNPAQFDALIEVVGNQKSKIGAPSNRKRTQNETTIYDVVILPKISKGEGYTDSRFEDRSNLDEAENTEKDPLSICDSKMDQKSYSCKYCDKTFKSDSKLQTHFKTSKHIVFGWDQKIKPTPQIKKQTIKKPVMHRCKYCCLSCPMASQLQRHILQSHNKLLWRMWLVMVAIFIVPINQIIIHTGMLVMLFITKACFISNS